MSEFINEPKEIRMIRIIALLIFIIVTYYRSDWRNWRTYHPTILLLIAGDYLANFLTYDHSLWELHSFFGGHTVNDLLLSVVLYPCTVLIFLTRFQQYKTWLPRVRYIVFWITLYSLIEWFASFWGGITYDHGWNLGWSVFINTVIFTIIPLHHYRPLVAYLMAVIIMVFITYTLDIPVNEWK
ncbi:CBO0543 family protein [Marinicrinis sediminis]|uniref:CBO0543 family protein n=1 Tax=Marinicrinis sediminis TaxID=1652465 RepID=A0ABW5RA02_9BACL